MPRGLSKLKKDRVPHTGYYHISSGTTVMNKGQQSALKRAKTNKAKRRVLSKVQRRKPQKPR